MIYVTGDMHGDQTRFYSPKLCPDGRLKAGDCLMICGDFGFIFKNDASEAAFLNDLEKFPYTVAFVDGNHENFPAIYAYPVEEWRGGRVHRIRKNILHLMRGEVYLIEDKKFFVFGGAYSIDKEIRLEGYSWWSEELPCNEQYRNASENLRKNDFKVDCILTHTMPTDMIYLCRRVPHPADAELTGFLGWIYGAVDFKHWYCGHWHEDRDLCGNFSMLFEEIRKI